MIKDELAHVLSTERDDVDEQYGKTMPLVLNRLEHVDEDGVTQRSARVVANTVFWAYYRSVYRKQKGFGGIAFVIQRQDIRRALSNLIISFLGLREVDTVALRADLMCPAMRDSRECVPYRESRTIHGLPFADLKSWDISNIIGTCNMAESFVFTDTEPSKWGVTATKSGGITRMEPLISEVFNLNKTLVECRAK